MFDFNNQSYLQSFTAFWQILTRISLKNWIFGEECKMKNTSISPKLSQIWKNVTSKNLLDICNERYLQSFTTFWQVVTQIYTKTGFSVIIAKWKTHQFLEKYCNLHCKIKRFMKCHEIWVKFPAVTVQKIGVFFENSSNGVEVENDSSHPVC